eukprot:SAG22_NODE_148_length_17459_cov_18.266359_2_plen_797_part_00
MCENTQGSFYCGQCRDEACCTTTPTSRQQGGGGAQYPELGETNEVCCNPHGVYDDGCLLCSPGDDWPGQRIGCTGRANAEKSSVTLNSLDGRALSVCPANNTDDCERKADCAVAGSSLRLLISPHDVYGHDTAQNAVTNATNFEIEGWTDKQKSPWEVPFSFTTAQYTTVLSVKTARYLPTKVHSLSCTISGVSKGTMAIRVVPAAVSPQDSTVLGEDIVSRTCLVGICHTVANVLLSFTVKLQDAYGNERIRPHSTDSVEHCTVEDTVLASAQSVDLLPGPQSQMEEDGSSVIGFWNSANNNYSISFKSDGSRLPAGADGPIPIDIHLFVNDKSNQLKQFKYQVVKICPADISKFVQMGNPDWPTNASAGSENNVQLLATDEGMCPTRSTPYSPLTGCLRTYSLDEPGSTNVAGRMTEADAFAQEISGPPWPTVTGMSESAVTGGLSTVQRNCRPELPHHVACMQYTFTMIVAGHYNLWIQLPVGSAGCKEQHWQLHNNIQINPARLDVSVSIIGCTNAADIQMGGNICPATLFSVTTADRALEFGVIPRDRYRNVRDPAYEPEDGKDSCRAIVTNKPTKSRYLFSCDWNIDLHRFMAIGGGAVELSGSYTIEVQLKSESAEWDDIGSGMTGSPFTLDVKPDVLAKVHIINQIPDATVGLPTQFDLQPVDQFDNVRQDNDTYKISTVPLGTNKATCSWVEAAGEVRGHFECIIEATHASPDFQATITLGASQSSVPPWVHEFNLMMRPHALNVSNTNRSSGPHFKTTVAGRLETFDVVPQDSYGNVRDQVRMHIS